jgi:glycosyltransferase involved in cell wall biosynthesis
VTIVVVPRDHFSDAHESLASVLENTPQSVPIIYVDGKSPRAVARWIEAQARARPFELVRRDYYLTPNQARNIGAARVDTKYVVFVDNDVIVAPDWLEWLVRCADETAAAVVGPLNYEQRPLFENVHFAGGVVRVDEIVTDGVQRRTLVDRILKERVPSAAEQTDVAEFHCMLVRMDVFRRVGGLDEKLLSTRENVDFCLAVREAGERVFLEPRSRINYLPPDPLRPADMPYFALRWSDAWDLSSFHHLRDKWRLEEDEYFLEQYRNLGWRRHGLLMRGGLLRWLGSWRARIRVELALRPIEMRVNALIARRHAQRHGLALR